MVLMLLIQVVREDYTRDIHFAIPHMAQVSKLPTGFCLLYLPDFVAGSGPKWQRPEQVIDFFLSGLVCRMANQNCYYP